MKFSNILFTSTFICIIGLGVGYYFYNQNEVSKQEAKSIRLPVEISCKALNKEESISRFHADVIKAGYQPVAISIQNKSDNYLAFSPSQVSPKTVSGQTVAQSCYEDKTACVAGLSVTGVLIPLLFPVLIIPAVVIGVQSQERNHKILTALTENSPSDRMIAPHANIREIVFIPREEYTNSIHVALQDRETHTAHTYTTQIA